jgi:uncharacterized protein (UPF0303 family)
MHQPEYPMLPASRSAVHSSDQQQGNLIMNHSKDLKIIGAQEKTLVAARLNADLVWKLGRRLRELALKRRAPVAIDIRRFGQVLFYCSLPGATPDNAEWIRRKSNVVQRFLRSSYAIGLSLKEAGATLASKYELTDADYAVHGGSFPLSVAGAGIVGSITVSGLPQREDHEMVVEALCDVLRRDYLKLALPKQ